MAISKITLNGEVQMDVTQDTVTANNLLSGETATGADGVGVTGNIATKTSSNMTVSGATVTAPAGYYATAASKSVASGSVTQNAPTINTSTGVVTATSTVTAGYVSAGTKSNTLSLTTQAAKTVTPTTSSQTAVASGRYTTGAVTVAAIPSQYIVPSGTKTITENGTGIDVASYASVDVNVSGGGGGVTYGSFTVNLDSSVGFPSNIGFVTFDINRTYYTYTFTVPLITNFDNLTKSVQGKAVVQDDGYMYVIFTGISNTYYPNVVATSGTATPVYAVDSNSPWYNVYHHPYVYRLYRLTPDAVVTFSYYNNN